MRPSAHMAKHASEVSDKVSDICYEVLVNLRIFMPSTHSVFFRAQFVGFHICL
jgi:hypothetical protein